MADNFAEKLEMGGVLKSLLLHHLVLRFPDILENGAKSPRPRGLLRRLATIFILCNGNPFP